MEDKMLEVIQSLATEGGLSLRTYVAWYFAYWTASGLLLSATILGLGGMGYRLTRRWQDHEWK